VQVGGGFDH